MKLITFSTYSTSGFDHLKRFFRCCYLILDSEYCIFLEKNNQHPLVYQFHTSFQQPEFSYGTIISYLIEYSIQNNPTYASNATASTTSITLTPLSSNSLYTVAVSARNSVGSGSLSDSINFRTISNGKYLYHS